VNGSLDEARVRRVVQRIIGEERPGGLHVLSRFQRLVRLDREAHTARVESAASLSDDVRATIEAGLARIYGSGIVTSYAQNPALLGGVRITVGSDVYDGSVQGRLAALEERF
jgi:F-type H+-transporting ATPase subunit delta